LLIPVEFVIGPASLGLKPLLKLFSIEGVNWLACSAHLQAFAADKIFRIIGITLMRTRLPHHSNSSTANSHANQVESSQAPRQAQNGGDCSGPAMLA
jgi:hypothetical protein